MRSVYVMHLNLGRGVNVAEEKKPEEAVEPSVQEEILEAVEDARPPMGFLRYPVEPVIEGIRPLEPLEPMSDSEYVDRVGAALAPSSIVPPMLPEAGMLQEPVAELVSPRLRGFTGPPRAALQFTCPYGFGGQCCGCRYLPCNELTLAVLGHVSRDYGPGGRCSADD